MRHFSSLRFSPRLPVCLGVLQRCRPLRAAPPRSTLVIDLITAWVAGGSSSTTPAGSCSPTLRLVTTPGSGARRRRCARPSTTTPHKHNDIWRLGDIGSATTPTSPSSNNQVTITRYHELSSPTAATRRASTCRMPSTERVRHGADRRCREPGFELVRHVAKA